MVISKSSVDGYAGWSVKEGVVWLAKGGGNGTMWVDLEMVERIGCVVGCILGVVGPSMAS